MSQNWFLAILQALRFYDPTDGSVSKSDKIQYVITHCVKHFRKTYSPSKELSIDKVLVAFKGRISYKQYSPLKRSRFGLKLYELTTSKGYVLNIILYTGKGTIDMAAEGHAYSVVMKLLQDYFRKGYTIYLDNYYTNLTLAEKLLKHGTPLMGHWDRIGKHTRSFERNQIETGWKLFHETYASFTLKMVRQTRYLYDINTTW